MQDNADPHALPEHIRYCLRYSIAPVKRIQIAMGYILAAWALGIILCLITLLTAEGYMAVTGQELLPVSAWLKLTGMIVLNTFVYARMPASVHICIRYSAFALSFTGSLSPPASSKASTMF